MDNNIGSFKKHIFEKVSSEYKHIEDFDSKKEAEKRAFFYRRKGYYFAFCMENRGKWRVYIE